MRELDARILRDGCFSLVGWNSVQQGFSLRLSINLSAPSLVDPGLVERVANVLAESGFDGHNLMLEVTETSLVTDVERLGHDRDDEVIVETIIRLAASLGIQVVAEGVETAGQQTILR